MKSKPFIFGENAVFLKEIAIFLQSSLHSSLCVNYANSLREYEIVRMNSSMWAIYLM